MAFFMSCSYHKIVDKTVALGPPKDPSAMTIASPYAILYSANFVIGNPKNAEDLLAIWKVWDSGNLAAYKHLLADTVEMHFSDGSVIHARRDSLVELGYGSRNSFMSVVSTVAAIMSVKSIDKNENWALIWGKEVDTDKTGQVDSFFLQETWRFNKDGKADLAFQFKSVAGSPRK